MAEKNPHYTKSLIYIVKTPTTESDLYDGNRTPNVGSDLDDRGWTPTNGSDMEDKVDGYLHIAEGTMVIKEY